MTALLSFAPLFRRQGGRLGLALLLGLVALAAGTALLGVSGWFLTAASLTTATAAFNLFGPSSLVRGFSLLRILARYAERLVGHDATLRLLADIRGWLFASLFKRLPFADRTLRHGDLVSRLTADVDALDTAFLVAIGPIVSIIVLGAAVSATLFLLIPGAGAVYAAALLAACLAAPALLALGTRRAGAGIVEASARTRMAVLDGTDGHADLIAFGAVDEARHGLARDAGDLAAARRRLAGWTALAAGTVQGLAGAALTGILWFGLGALEAGTVGGPLLVGLLLAAVGSFEAAGALVRSVAKLGAATAAARRLREMADAPPRILDPVQAVPLPEGGDLLLDRIVYGHEPGRPVLRGLDLRIGQGERVAVLGPSGCGKSTLLGLLLRLDDPQEGCVRIAGADLRTVAQADVHRRVALLGQDAPVFLGTVRENLLIGRADATDADLWLALDRARLADFVRGLPDGLETFLGEAGRTLSAGQARRLGLARVLLSRAAVLLLDEPTCGLDRETELEFLADLKQATAGRTVLLVTHAGLPEGAADRVFRLEEGRLVPLLPLNASPSAPR